MATHTGAGTLVLAWLATRVAPVAALVVAVVDTCRGGLTLLYVGLVMAWRHKLLTLLRLARLQIEFWDVLHIL
jgi:hypothetical protein